MVDNMVRAEILSTDRDSLLESLSFDLMSDNIQNQILYNNTSTVDFMDVIKRKFDTILNMQEVEDEDKVEIKYQMIEFCNDLIGMIADTHNLFINLLSEDYESYMELLDTLYNFFVLNRFVTVEKFLINYINQNKLQLIEAMDIGDDKRKDITTLSNKKKNISKNNIYILSNIDQVIRFIHYSQLVNPMEFIETILDGEYYTEQIKEYYIEGTISGDFTVSLLNSVLSDDYDTSEVTRIRNNIRISLYEEGGIDEI